MPIVAQARWSGRRIARLSRETRMLPNPGQALLRWAAFAAVRPFTPMVSAQLNGIRYFVSTADQSVGRLCFMGALPEAELFDQFVTLLEEAVGRPLLSGRIFVEVGANIGTTTLPAALRHGARQVIALEPAPENLKLLRVNLVANDVDAQRVRVLPVAASDWAGEVDLEICAGNPGDCRVRASDKHRGPDLYGEGRRPVVRIPTVRLDDLLTAEGIDLDCVGLVWIDSQGHEAHVLAGAPNVLASGAPIVLEYWPYGLRRSAGLDRLHNLISGSGRRIIDLRASVAAGAMVWVSADNVASLTQQYPGQDYTDLALLPVV